MLPVELSQPPFEIIAHQHDGEVGGTLADANSQRAQRGTHLICSAHIHRLNAHATFFEIALRSLGRKAEARPISGRRAQRSAGRRDNEAAIQEPLEGFPDLVRLKVWFQLGNDLPKAACALPYCRGQRAVKLTVKKELPVLGIEANDIAWQHIDGEIRREPQYVFAVAQSAGV